MADELNEDETAEREAFFDFVEGLVDKMYALFTEHESVVQEYSLAMEYIQGRDWHSAYVQRVASRDSVEGTGGSDGDSVD